MLCILKTEVAFKKTDLELKLNSAQAITCINDINL